MTLPKISLALVLSLSLSLIAFAQAPAQVFVAPPGGGAPPPPPPLPPPPPGMVTKFPDKPDPSVQIPQFDVISVKPHSGPSSPVPGMMIRIGMQMTADGFRGENVNAHMLLTNAFGVNNDQILNEPDWAKSQSYDIEAKVAGPDVATLAKLTRDQRSSMDQQVLTDRFKLAYHREDRDLPVYNLVVGKGGPKLTEAKPDPNSPNGPRTQMRVTSANSGRMQMDMKNTTMADLAKMLTNQTGRTVVDKTGLTGHYDISLEFASQGMMGFGGGGTSAAPGPDAEADSASPSIFTAIQDLGLKLDSGKGPASVLIIDHIEKPAEN